MNHPTLPGAAESAASAAALPTSSTLASGVQETPAAQTTDLQLARSNDAPSPTAATTLVTATPVLPLAALPKTIGLPDRQRLALQALAAGNSVEDAARIAGISLSTLFRWRKYHPQFIAAWNAWQAESQKTARDLLVVANEHAARTVLRAAQNGDVRASLAVLKAMGTLAPQKAGAELARAVEIELLHETYQAKSSIRGDTRAMRQERCQQKQKEKQAAALAEQRRQWLERYFQIPPLPRPVTPEAVAQSVKETTGLSLREDACSITLTAATGDRAALVKLIGKYGKATALEVQNQLNSLPKLLSWMVLSHAVEGVAKELESLGATVELRPGWSD
jgi:transposase-like protein